ncbi:MAG: hypothetical protein RLZZ480_301 [Candidatus Parcubacteria bacterium]
MFIPHTYDLSFFRGDKKRGLPPAIVFTIKESFLEEAIGNMSRFVSLHDKHITAYLHDLEPTFTFPTPDLFGNTEFGFGSCGRVEVKDGEVKLYVEIGKRRSLYYQSLTIQLLSIALQTDAKETKSNRTQQLDLDVKADRHASAGWGHMLGGYVSMSVVEWLKQYAAEHAESESFWSTSMHPGVIDSMRTAWNATSTRPLRKYADESNGRISQDGRFYLVCSGNACDLSIYPDIPIYEGCEYVPFGCHNLDGASQQLTLLAGLVKILELARSSE